GRRRAARWDFAGRAGRARKGATTLDDPRDRRAGGARPGHAQPAPERQAPGDRDGDRGRQAVAERGARAQGSLADATVEGTDPRGAGDPAPGGADPGEAQQDLEPDEPRTGMFRSLRIRNYRMFAIGGAVSNVGTWLQRT